MTLYMRLGGSDVKIAVIIVYYNSYRFMERLFESLASQDYDLDRLLLVVIDNASPDNATEELARMASERFPNYAIYRSGSNLGFAGANNLGIRLVEKTVGAGEPVVVLLNPDTYVARRSFLRDTELLASRLDAVIGFATVSGDRGDVIDGLGGYIDRFGSARDLLCCRPMRGFAGLAYRLHPPLYLSPLACFAAVAIPWRILRRLGWLRTDYFMYFEDTEYSLRAWSRGIPVVIVKGGYVWHARGGTQKQPASGRRIQDPKAEWTRYSISAHFVKNSVLVAYEYLGLEALAARLAALLASAALGEGRLIARALWEAARALRARPRRRRLPRGLVPRSLGTTALLWSLKAMLAGVARKNPFIYGLQRSNLEYVMCRLRAGRPWGVPRC